MKRRRHTQEEIQAIWEKGRDLIRPKHFAFVEPHSYEDDLLQDFGTFYRSQLAIVRDRIQSYRSEIAENEGRYQEKLDADPFLAKAFFAQLLAKQQRLLVRWEEEEQRVLKHIEELEAPFWI